MVAGVYLCIGTVALNSLHSVAVRYALLPSCLHAKKYVPSIGLGRPVRGLTRCSMAVVFGGRHAVVDCIAEIEVLELPQVCILFCAHS